MSNVFEFMRTQPEIDYRYWFVPSKPLTSGLIGELTFKGETL